MTGAAVTLCLLKEKLTDKNSAKEAAKDKLQMPATTSPQMTASGPPLGRANDILAPRAVHEFRMAKARPSMDNSEKLRCNSCLMPRLAKMAASSWMLVLRRPVLDLLRSRDILRPQGAVENRL